MNPLCHSNPFAINMAKGFLHVTEQAYITREGDHHGPNLPKDLIPFFDADPPLGGGEWQTRSI